MPPTVGNDIITVQNTTSITVKRGNASGRAVLYSAREVGEREEFDVENVAQYILQYGTVLRTVLIQQDVLVVFFLFLF